MRTCTALFLGITVALFTSCQSTPPPPENPTEQTIQQSIQTVRRATIRVMKDRGYLLTPAGSETLLFDRPADYGPSITFDVLYAKAAWRRVRINLLPDNGATRVTAEPSLLTDRGNAFEQEKPDTSKSARQAMQEILSKIADAARRGG